VLANRLEAEMPGDMPWTVFDRNLVETMLNSRHLSPRLARFLPEDKVSEIDASVGELVGLHPSLWELTQRTNELMRHLARSGHVILVGRGANLATAAIANGVHVRLVASTEHRAQQTARELDVTPAEAEVHNAKVDAARRKYVRSVFGTEIEHASGYDLVINVATIPVELAASLVSDVLLCRVGALR
jgi:cytidylate kinase